MNHISLCNLNFWKSVVDMPFRDKDIFVAEKILNEAPLLTSINEHASKAENISLLSRLLKGKYTVIEPLNWDNTIHPKSLQNLLVLKAGIKYNIRNVKTILPNRLIVIDANIMGEGKPAVHIVNLYMVQTSILLPHMRKRREQLHAQLFEEVKNLLESFKGQPTILMGDLQATCEDDEIRYLLDELGYYEPKVLAPVGTFSNKTIDHILFSEQAKELLKPRNFTVDNSTLAISDHSYISVEVA